MFRIRLKFDQSLRLRPVHVPRIFLSVRNHPCFRVVLCIVLQGKSYTHYKTCSPLIRVSFTQHFFTSFNHNVIVHSEEKYQIGIHCFLRHLHFQVSFANLNMIRKSFFLSFPWVWLLLIFSKSVFKQFWVFLLCLPNHSQSILSDNLISHCSHFKVNSFCKISPIFHSFISHSFLSSINSISVNSWSFVT